MLSYSFFFGAEHIIVVTYVSWLVHRKAIVWAFRAEIFWSIIVSSYASKVVIGFVT